MSIREAIPLSVRQQIAAGARIPANEMQRRREELRGFRFGQQLKASGNGGNGVTHLADKHANRLETYFSKTGGPGILKWSHYFDIYDRHFAKFVGRDVYVVEIGVLGGGSLEMWLDYFGAGCHVHGIDIDPACRAFESQSVTITIGDQANPEFWSGFLAMVPRIDIVIDDGGHRTRQQVKTFEAVFSHIQPGGVYLCEDIHGTSNPFHDYLGGLSRNLNAAPGPTDFQKMVGSIHLYPFISVVERPEHPLEDLTVQMRGRG